MMRSEYFLHVVAAVIAVLVSGCQLVVDFDRALLVDAGVDGGADAGLDAAVDTGSDAAGDAGVEAR